MSNSASPTGRPGSPGGSESPKRKQSPTAPSMGSEPKKTKTVQQLKASLGGVKCQQPPSPPHPHPADLVSHVSMESIHLPDNEFDDACKKGICHPKSPPSQLQHDHIFYAKDAHGNLVPLDTAQDEHKITIRASHVGAQGQPRSSAANASMTPSEDVRLSGGSSSSRQHSSQSPGDPNALSSSSPGGAAVHQSSRIMRGTSRLSHPPERATSSPTGEPIGVLYQQMKSWRDNGR